MAKELKRKKLLMLSAKDSEIPLILTARRMGYYVITTGNKSDRAGHAYADEYIPFDFSDYDGLARLVSDYEIDALCQGCNDHCALAASAVGAIAGLPGHDSFAVSEILHRKDRFKTFAKSCGLPSPQSEWFADLGEALAYKERLSLPVIVKPTDLAGGAGVSVARTPLEYERAVRNAFAWSAASRVVVETFVEGTLHSLTTFIVDEHVVACASANDYSFKNRFLTNSGKFPADNDEKAVEALVPVVERVARELHLVNGLLHLQYMEDRAGDLWIIEMMRRSPGNNYTVALSRSSGIDWMEWIIRAEAGEDVSDFPQVRNPVDIFAYHSVMGERNGEVLNVEVDNCFVPFVRQYTEWMKRGDLIGDYLNEKVGSVQLQFPKDIYNDAFLAQVNSHIRVNLR